MKTISIHLNTKNKALTVEHPLERFILQVLIVVLGISLCGYLYFVSASVLNVMARQEASQHATSLEGQIGGLEQQYYALSQSMTPDTAASIGLAAVTQTDYVYQPGTVGLSDVSSNAI